MIDDDSLLKVFFQLYPDEDDYPPASVESVWAIVDPASPGVTIDNTPFFAREATLGDVVSTRLEDGCHWFESVLQRSEYSLVRVYFFELDCMQRVREFLVGLGCSTESAPRYRLLAVSIPASVSLSDVQAYLQAEKGRDNIDYEEPILRQ
ncbi:DUF4265 domain-containing protein [Myxococcus hansupus]|uniref:DUF4265 domain-containing protein n=1 Tax=Pseudomyxococcus hansupus TaxID=1297742 RepID=UPI000B2FADB7|nr:DUF4265 domain-containing protein [Myxococcus hansupus]